MERVEFVAVLQPLVVTLGGGDLDQPAWTAYYRALKDIPARWLSAAVDASLRQDRAFLPKPGELRALAMQALGEAQKQLTAGDCDDCGNTRWLEREIDGVKRAERCGCWDRYRDAVAALGAVAAPVPQLLPADVAFDARMARAGVEE